MNSCPFINTTLIFSDNSIAPCYIFQSAKIPLYSNQELIENGNIDFKQRKNEINKILNSEEIQNFHCQNCRNLTTSNQDNNKFNYILLSLISKTNYEYDFLNAIKQLYEQDMIDKENLKIKIQFKDFSKMPILEQIISLFEGNGYKEIIFVMNNATYIHSIKECLKKGKSSIQININFKDNGDLIEKKRGLQYILRSYLSEAKDKNAVCVHYQLIKDYNDTENDITSFITQMYMLGINKIGLKLENKDIINWLKKPLTSSEYHKKIRNITLLFFKLSNKYSFYIDMNFQAQTHVLKKIFKTYKNKKEKKIIDKIKILFKKKGNK